MKNSNSNQGNEKMKTWRMEMGMIGVEGGWVDRGTISGRSESATLKRAFHLFFDSWFEGHPKVGATVYHSRITGLPVFRIVPV